MDASKLTPEQAHRLVNSIAPMVGYLYRLAHAMQRMGWDPADPMYVSAWEAYNALHALRVHCHYAGCMPGGGGPTGRTAPPSSSV